MNLRDLALVPLASAALAGCFASAFGAGAQNANYAAAMGGPSHAPTTAAQWSALDQSAAATARSSGASDVSPAIHMTARGYMVEQSINLEGGRCYTASLAWGFGRNAMVSVGMEPDSNGQRANDQWSVHPYRLSAPGGVAPFCTDRAGKARFTITAITPEGTMANNELLEYALVLGSRTESVADAETRRQNERALVAAGEAQMEANVAASRARDAANLARRCSQCRQEFHDCEIDMAVRRHNGLTHASDAQCGSAYRACAQGGIETRLDEAPCGVPQG
jgi:hypothetical protein